MKRIIRQLPNDQKVADISQESAFDVEALMDKGGEILRREIQNLMIESTGKKLSSASSRDLVAYLRLLSELQKDQKETLTKLTDEELINLNETK